MMNPMMYIQSWWYDFRNLFYPKLCDACGVHLMKNEDILCTQCQYKLPRTKYHEDHENALAQIFWGRVHLERATALFHFVKGSKYRKLIHKLKYQGRKDLGIYLGMLLGVEVKDVPDFSQAACIVPVPLHPKRKKQRGYNQAEQIAFGLSAVLNIPVSNDNLIRRSYTETQTKKSRFDRWENVSKVFHIKAPEEFEGKHLILVDDVITTGSTIEACAQNLLELKDVKLSIACLGAPQ